MLNAKWVDRCNTYSLRRKNQGVEHLTFYLDLNAKNPLIHVSLVEEKWKFFN